MTHSSSHVTHQGRAGVEGVGKELELFDTRHLRGQLYDAKQLPCFQGPHVEEP